MALQDVRQTDEGSYQCVAKNVVGIRESFAAFLKVYGELKIDDKAVNSVQSILIRS